MIAASAPGKVVLSGEYAVLDGAPAICMAIDRRARAVIGASDSDVSTVAAASYTKDIGRFRSKDGILEWLQGQSAFSVVDSVWRIANVADAPALAINLDSSEFVDDGTGLKIGIGSSAAITVALVMALKGSDDSANIATITTIAQRAHADFQGGIGSGVDIACSLTGGLIEYRIAGASTTRLEWPEGLKARLIWTGQPANTRDKLSQLEATVSKPSRVRLAGSSEDMALAWRSADAGKILVAYHEYIECLAEFSIDHNLGIFDAGHSEIRRAASAENLIYKPCGAGGGDVGIVLGSDALQLDTFARQLASKYTVLDWGLSATGAIIEESKAEKE